MAKSYTDAKVSREGGADNSQPVSISFTPGRGDIGSSLIQLGLLRTLRCL
ncbi:hypothetical protein PAJL_388 [Cutibacterium acnes HL042PA3]|nr:hypothetical protein PAJL_388 [Cutibacterium acnes HL042PA3]